MVSARHAFISQHELREEGDVEADQDQDRRDPRQRLVVEPAGDLGPPEMEPAEEGGHAAADHDIVEMGDDEIGVGHMHVDREHRQHQPGEAARHEQPDEAQREQQGRVDRDVRLVEGDGPVIDLDRAWHRDGDRQEGKDRARINRLARHEHVMAPHHEADDGDRDRGEGDEPIAEDALVRGGGDEFAHHAERGQHHDVDGRVAVEPEEMLEQQRVAAQPGVEHADADQPLGRDQQQRDRQHRRRQHEDDRHGIMRPDEQRQAAPGHAGRTQLVDCDDEVEAGQDRRKSADEHRDDGRHHCAVGVDGR